MAFKCQNCKVAQPSGTKTMKVVTEIRKVRYAALEDEKGHVRKIPIGHETVKELIVCPECATLPYQLKVSTEEKIIV